MTFFWPEMLWLLLLVPVLLGAYVLLLRRKKKAALRYASLSLVREAMGAGQRFRRHVPPLLFLMALALMLFAVARPSAVVTLPSQHETVILAMDVSGKHARDRRQAEPHGRNARGRAGVRRRAAEDDANRHRLVRRDSVARAITDAQPRGHPRRDRPLQRCSAAPPWAAASSCR